MEKLTVNNYYLPLINPDPFSPGILWKNSIEKTNMAALNGCISKATANSESKLAF